MTVVPFNTRFVYVSRVCKLSTLLVQNKNSSRAHMYSTTQDSTSSCCVDYDSNKNSLRTGDPENSGFSSMQLRKISYAARGEGLYHLLEEVLQPHSPGLEKPGAELGYYALGW